MPSHPVHRRPAVSHDMLAIIYALPSETFCPDCGVLAVLREMRGAPVVETGRLPAQRECPRCGRIFRMEWLDPMRKEFGGGVVCHRMYGPMSGPRVDPTRV